MIWSADRCSDTICLEASLNAVLLLQALAGAKTNYQASRIKKNRQLNSEKKESNGFVGDAQMQTVKYRL